MHVLLGIILYVFMFALSFAFPLAISAIFIGVFDFIFGTAYFTPPIIGGLAILIYLVGSINNRG